jgi:hypothetical protein
VFCLNLLPYPPFEKHEKIIYSSFQTIILATDMVPSPFRWHIAPQSRGVVLLVRRLSGSKKGGGQSCARIEILCSLLNDCIIRESSSQRRESILINRLPGLSVTAILWLHERLIRLLSSQGHFGLHSYLFCGRSSNSGLPVISARALPRRY